MNPAHIIMAVARYATTRLADTCCRVFTFSGQDMAHTTTAHTPAPIPEPCDLADIDEALRYTSMTGPRDEHWHRWLDALLDQRNTLANTKPHAQP